MAAFGLSQTQFLNLYNPVLGSAQSSLLLSSKALRYFVTHLRFATPFYMTALIELFSYEVRNVTVNNHKTSQSHQQLLTRLKLVKSSQLSGSQLARDLTIWAPKYNTFYYSVRQAYKLVTYLKILTLLTTVASTPIGATQGILVYQFRQLSSAERIFLFVPTNQSVPVFGQKSEYTKYPTHWGISIAQLFSSARWLEREVSELFGVQLLGMVDRRNLLLQYGETSAPLKKSYPSAGWYEIYYVPTYNALIERFLTHTE